MERINSGFSHAEFGGCDWIDLGESSETLGNCTGEILPLSPPLQVLGLDCEVGEGDGQGEAQGEGKGGG